MDFHPKVSFEASKGHVNWKWGLWGDGGVYYKVHVSALYEIKNKTSSKLVLSWSPGLVGSLKNWTKFYKEPWLVPQFSRTFFQNKFMEIRTQKVWFEPNWFIITYPVWKGDILGFIENLPKGSHGVMRGRL